MSRKKRNRYRDVFDAGRPTLIQRSNSEGYEAWHRRRQSIAADNQEAAKRWCEERGVELRILNNGEHWQFRHKPTGKRVEWWPSTAKLVCDQRWKQGVHVHDWKQAVQQAEKHFGKLAVTKKSVTAEELVSLGEWI